MAQSRVAVGLQAEEPTKAIDRRRLTPEKSGASMKLSDYLLRWQQESLAAYAPIKWCVVCETREQSKHLAPYCSTICKEAGERQALMDRR